MSKALYDETFYRSQVEGSYRSAVVYADILTSLLPLSSVADLGCGRGTWLKAFAEIGATRLAGFDGHWNSQDGMIDQRIKFISADLNRRLPVEIERFDLAISLEVAEHLKTTSSLTFVRNLTSLSDAVLFGAAFRRQGGTDHINEQLHSYWADLFKAENYLPYDVFRPAVWGRRDVEFWYQQNAFLYVKEGSDADKRLKNNGHQPIFDKGFMNAVHPDLLDIWVSRAQNPLKAIFRRVILNLLPNKYLGAAVSLKRKLKIK